jgi:signal transduction histidine kinase/ActR/RegA family two-component response regulator
MHPHFQVFILILLLCSKSFIVYAKVESSIEVTTANQRIDHLFTHLALKKTLTPEEALKRAFTPLTKNEANFDYSNKHHWLKTKVRNSSAKSLERYIVIHNPLLDDVEFYLSKTSGTTSHWQNGNHYPFSTRLFSHRHFVFPINLKPYEEGALVIRIKSKSSIKVPIYLWEPVVFNENDHLQEIINGFFFGALSLLIIYNLCLYWSAKDLIFLYYIGIMFSILGFFLSISGYGFQYIWSTSTTLQEIAPTFNLSLTLYFLSKFSSTFLKSKYGKTNSSPILNLMSHTSITYATISIVSVNYWITSTQLVFIITSGIIFLFRITNAWHNHGLAIRYFISAWYTIIFSISLYALDNFFIISNTDYLNPTLLIMTISVAILLSLALGADTNEQHLAQAKAKHIALKSQREALRAHLTIKESEYKRQQEKIALEAETQAKNELIAMVSHEIRTPLNGIMGMSNLLIDTQINQTQEHYIKTIIHSSEALLRILNDIIDYSKISSGKLDVESIELDLLEIIEECATLFSQQRIDKSLYFIAYLKPGSRRFIKSDPTRIRQVILNYLSNAFKFTDYGGIEFWIESTSQQLNVHIKDTGNGIAKDKIPRLFRTFSQADTSTSRQYGGTGLGLAICKRLSEIMQGSVGVRSVKGSGSDFWFKCRVSPSKKQEISVSLKGQYWVLLNKNTVEQKLIEQWFRYHEANIISITSKEYLTTLNQNLTIDGVLFDPACIYYHTIKNLQQSCLVNRWIAITDTPNQVNAELELEEISRPLTHLGLHNLFVVSINEKPWIALNDLKELNANSQDILVAEDNPVNQLVIKGMLSKLNIKYTIVNNGQEAIDAFSKNPRQWQLVLMDCEMPKIDGFTASINIRNQSKEGQKIPIIALTAHATDEHKKKAKESGMNDFISKPIKIEALKMAILKALNKEF